MGDDLEPAYPWARDLGLPPSQGRSQPRPHDHLVSDDDTVDVWRVEHRKNLRGPYNSREHDETLEEMRYAHSGTANRHLTPSPYNDGIEWPNYTYNCGFASRERLAEWFVGWMPELAERGFVCRRYTVPADLVQYGRRQLMFDRDHAIPQDDTNLLSLM